MSARRIWWSARASRYAKAVSRSETTAVLVDDGHITSAVASLSGQKRKGQHRAAHGYYEMHTTDANRILSDPLPFGDPLRMTAQTFLAGLAEAQKLAEGCRFCCGLGQRIGII